MSKRFFGTWPEGVRTIKVVPAPEARADKPKATEPDRPKSVRNYNGASARRAK